MKHVAALFLCFLTVGCAGTTVSINGQVVLHTQADCASLEFHQGSTSLVMTGVNHSGPTRAGGSLIGTTGAAIGGVLVAAATKGVIR